MSARHDMIRLTHEGKWHVLDLRAPHTAWARVRTRCGRALPREGRVTLSNGELSEGGLHRLACRSCLKRGWREQ